MARWIKKERHRQRVRSYTGTDANGEEHTIFVTEESCGEELFCSECDAHASDYFTNYCSKCGAKMENPEE